MFNEIVISKWSQLQTSCWFFFLKIPECLGICFILQQKNIYF